MAETSFPRQSILSVTSLCAHRGAVRVLHEVSWTVHAGEMWTILGPNGCGKTSLLGCLTGYFIPSAGTVCLLGETYGESDWIGLRRRVGIVSSSIRQMVEDDEPILNVIASGMSGQINYWGRLTETEKSRARSMAKDVNCSHLLGRNWGVISQGERQRVLIGRALMGQPDLIILDEPCAGLDPVTREQFIQFMQTLAKTPDGPALILVTHHVEEIPEACTHILGLREGCVAASGPVSTIMKSSVLSNIFDRPVRLRKKARRWQLEVLDAH